MPTAVQKSKENLIDTIKHIEGYYHTYTREALNTLIEFAEKISIRHGADYPEIDDALALLKGMKDEMAIHMNKEELVLFPYIRDMVLATEKGEDIPPTHFGTVEKPIAVMMADHDDVGNDLTKLKAFATSLSRNPSPCNTFQAFLNGVAEFEKETMLHVHLENNYLFPEALALEQKHQPA